MMDQLPTSLFLSIRVTVLLFVMANVYFQIYRGPKPMASRKYFVDEEEEAVAIRGGHNHSSNIPAPAYYLAAMTETTILPVSDVLPLCTREQIQNGQWHRLTLDKPPYIPPFNNPYLMCGSVERYHQDHFDTWEWRPHDDNNNNNNNTSCEFMKWDKDLFCQLIHGENMVIVGDSLSEEALYDMSELLHIRYSSDDFVGGPRYNWTHACGDNYKFAIHFRRDDYLQPQKVKWELSSKMPLIAVLNRGAHFVNDDSLMEQINETIGYVREWQSQCDELDKHCLLIWRTSVPGHPNCHSYKQLPDNVTLLQMEALIQANRQSRKYHWHEFQRQNLLIEQALKESNVRYQILDAYYINIVRPDDHRYSMNDCLHTCLGSKLDVYAQIILHYLRQLRQSAQ